MIYWKYFMQGNIHQECRLPSWFNIRRFPDWAATVMSGCIGSAGYVWCEVQKDCIRLFEKGIRTEAVNGGEAFAFIVFSPDLYVLNSSSQISNPMKYWKDVACRRVAMCGM